jgi:hypothetical protein
MDFIRRRWISILTLLGFVPSLWSGIKWLFDWGARVDLVATKIELGWGDALMEFLLNPPPWFAIVAVPIGLLLIWWDSRRQQFKKPTEPLVANQAPPIKTLDLDFDEKIPGCRVQTNFNNVVEAVFFRVKVRNDTGRPQTSCRGRLIGLQRKDEFGEFVDFGYAERLQLTWGIHTPNGLPLTADIPNGEEEFLDVFFVTALGQIALATKGFVAPNSLPHPFSEAGTYLLTISIGSNENEPKRIQLIFATIVGSDAAKFEIKTRVRRYP